MTTKKVTEPAVETDGDVEALTAVPDTVELQSGTVVRVNRIRTRETFSLLKILSVGLGPALLDILGGDDDDDSEEAFTGKMLGAVVAAIPDAEDETMEFILRIVSPIDLIEKPRTKEQRNVNDTLYVELYEELENPELEDTISILENVIRREAPHFRALGKRLMTLLPTVAPKKK